MYWVDQNRPGQARPPADLKQEPGDGSGSHLPARAARSDRAPLGLVSPSAH